MVSYIDLIRVPGLSSSPSGATKNLPVSSPHPNMANEQTINKQQKEMVLCVLILRAFQKGFRVDDTIYIAFRA